MLHLILGCLRSALIGASRSPRESDDTFVLECARSLSAAESARRFATFDRAHMAGRLIGQLTNELD